jgi:hypothetical protein
MTNSLTVFGQVAAQAGLVVNGGNAQFNGPAIATNTLTANGLATFNGGVRTNNISTINISTANINLSSVNGAIYPPPAAPPAIPSSIFLSTVNVDGNLAQSGLGTFSWGGNTINTAQVILSRPTSVNNTLTTTGATFLNSGATVNSGLTVATGGVNVNSVGVVISNGGLFVNNNTTLNGGTSILNGLSASGTATFQNQVNMNQNATVFGGLSVNNGCSLAGGVNLITGNFTMNQFGASANVPILNATATCYQHCQHQH